MKVAIKIGLLYALLSACYIIVSDVLVGFLTQEPVKVIQYQLVKGLGFVSVSALIIAALVGYHSRQRERAEREREEARSLAEQAKSHFLSAVSHEMRTPLHGTVGFIDLARTEVDEGKRLEYLQLAAENAQELAKLIDLLLEAASVESERIVLHPSEVSLRGLLDSLITLYRPVCEAKGLQFKVEVGEGVPEKLHADELRLRQVLQNLLSNAVKFTKTGMIRLSVRCPAGGFDSRMISFEVADTGIGIPPERMRELFHSFHQLQNGAARHYSGMGVGLFISKHIVDLMGGTISATSEQGAGSVFTVTAPLAASEVEATASG